MRGNSSSEVGIAPVRLRTDREGLAMVLGSLELAIMQVLWEAPSDRSLTNKELRFELTRLGTPLAISTISNTMHRLANKGYVREMQQGDLYVYTPVMSEEELELWLVAHIFAQFYHIWPGHVQEVVSTYDDS